MSDGEVVCAPSFARPSVFRPPVASLRDDQPSWTALAVFGGNPGWAFKGNGFDPALFAGTDVSPAGLLQEIMSAAIHPECLFPNISPSSATSAEVQRQ